MALTFGKVTLTEVACALILGIIVNHITPKDRAVSVHDDDEKTVALKQDRTS